MQILYNLRLQYTSVLVMVECVIDSDFALMGDELPFAKLLYPPQNIHTFLGIMTNSDRCEGCYSAQ